MANFTRTVEDFACARCGAQIRGTGYTNHCPRCLFSRHVDVKPGDRAAGCGGLMEPVSVESRREGYVIVHRCTACGHTGRNKAAADDDFEVLLAVARKR